jgi:hypothetical protein
MKSYRAKGHAGAGDENRHKWQERGVGTIVRQVLVLSREAPKPLDGTHSFNLLEVLTEDARFWILGSCFITVPVPDRSYR